MRNADRSFLLASGLRLIPLLALILLPERSSALPDLTAEVFDVNIAESDTVNPGDVVEGCAGAQTGRRLLHFSLRTRNLGPDDLIMGDPACPNCSRNPGAVCGNPLYVCSEAHGHPHFEGFSRADLIDATGQVVVSGHKQGFCLLDLDCDDPVYTCGFQGISAGCSDVYDAGLPCQYIDLTDAAVPDGTYTLRVAVDADSRITEADESNNSASVPVTIGAPPEPPAITCPVSSATDLPMAILDEGSVTSTLSIADLGLIQHLRVVNLEGRHTYVSDLRMTLRSPQGTTATLLPGGTCGDSDDFYFDVADGGSTLHCPLNDHRLRAPATPLAPLLGEAAAGSWTLEVEDLETNDTGWLDGWGLEICADCGNGTLDAGETCDDGNTADGDCCSANCQIPATDGTACDDPAQCTVGGVCTSGVCTGGTVRCDPCLTCSPPQGCVPPEHVLCDAMSTEAASLLLVDHPNDPKHDSVAWRFTSGSPVALLDFGSPTTVTDLTLCIFDQSGLKLSSTVPAAGTCHEKPCWRADPTKLKYVDSERTPDGIEHLLLRSGEAGRAGLLARGQGEGLGLTALDLNGTVTARLVRSGGPACWQAEFATAQRNDARVYKARTGPHRR